MMNKDQFLKVEEVAEALKLHPYTIRRLCREDKIPCFKFGGQWRFDKKDLQEWGKKKKDRREQ